MVEIATEMTSADGEVRSNTAAATEENWTVNVVKTQAGVAGYQCSGEWFGAMGIALDPLDSELYISYFADIDGTDGTGITDSDAYKLLKSGFISIVEDQATIVGE